MNITEIGAGPVQIVWAHGWGMDNRAFAPMAMTFAAMARSFLPDFAGFGKTPLPPAPWGTRDYADSAAAWLRSLPRDGKRIWVGHSFGCRVGLQIAAHYPELIDALVLVGAAGLPRRRSLWQRLGNWARVRAFKFLKLFVPEGPKRDALRARFGSADYRNAGPLRPTFLKVIAEDLSPEAARVSCPTLIIVGADDADAPPEISRRLHGLIKNSDLHVLDGYDHHTILGPARHQVCALVKPFMDRL